MAKKNQCSYSSKLLYWSVYAVLLALRLASAFSLNPGYTHPDEMFQSVELAAYDIFPDSCSLLTWEFLANDRGPVRSRSAIWPFVHMPIILAEYFRPIQNASALSGDELVQRIIVPARMFTTILSLIPDAFVFWLSRRVSNGQERPIALLLYASMVYGGLTWGSRTLSNAWETVAVCLFCFLSLHNGTLHLMLQAAISVWAIFLRPSFPFFVLPFAFLQIFDLIRSPSRLCNIFIRIPIGLLTAACTAALLIYADTVYYTGKVPTDISELVITPLRFIKYNSAEETLSEHGLHPWYHYIAVHWPLMITPVLALAAFWPPKREGQGSSVRFTAWSAIVIATAILSSVGHKEPRFILPCFPLAIVLAANRLRSWRTILLFWVSYQAILFGFWGFAHQGGLLPFLRSLKPAEANEVSVNIFYKTYMPPRFPFGAAGSPSQAIPPACLALAPLDAQCTRVADFAGRPESELLYFMYCLNSQAEHNTVARLVSAAFIV